MRTVLCDGTCFKLSVFLFSQILFVSLPAHAVTSYTTQGYFVQLLDDLPEQLANPTIRDINVSGQLAGRTNADEGVTIDQAAFWDVDGSITNLDDNNQEFYSEGYGINDVGDVVGHSEDQMFIWSGGIGTNILDSNGFSVFGHAHDINNNGTIVGGSGFYKVGGVSGSLERLLATEAVYPKAVNELDQIAGDSGSLSSPADVRAVTWTNGAVTLLPVTVDVVESFAADINDAGDVAGRVRSGNLSETRAVLWKGGLMVELGSLGGTQDRAYGINNVGQVVGLSNDHPFLWNNGVMTDLYSIVAGLCTTTLPCTASARVINDEGVIAGSYFFPGTPNTPQFRGITRAFKITPLNSGVAGDINNDGAVNTADLILATRILTGQINGSPGQLSRGDVAPLVSGSPAPDGQFNTGDFTVLIRRVLGVVSF